MSILAHISTIDRENLFDTSLFSNKKSIGCKNQEKNYFQVYFNGINLKKSFTSSFIDQNDFL